MNEYAIQHHGILGQKWGVRRYQNLNGTLTEAGKKRYSSSEVKEARRNLSTEKEKLTAIERRKYKIESETDYLNNVNKARNKVIDGWDEINNRPLSKKEANALWDKYEKTYEKALKNNQEYQQLLKDYDMQKAKVDDLSKAAEQKIGSDYVEKALGALGTYAAVAIVAYFLQKYSNNHSEKENNSDPFKDYVIVDKNGNPVDIEF